MANKNALCGQDVRVLSVQAGGICSRGLLALMIYNMIYLLTAIGLTPGGGSTVHIYTQTVHRTTQFTNWEECGPCPVFASYSLAFALQLRKKHRKPSVRIIGECQLAR